MTAEPDSPLTDAHIKDVKDSGLTCVHMTLGPVGTNAPDAAFTPTGMRLATVVSGHAAVDPAEWIFASRSRPSSPDVVSRA